MEDLLFNVYVYLKEIDEEVYESVVVKLEDRYLNDDIVRFFGKLKVKVYEFLMNLDREFVYWVLVYINFYF